MDQDKAYETTMNIAVKAIERIENIFTEEMDNRKEAGRSSVDLARDYASSLASVTTILSTAALLRPLTPFASGFCAGKAEEEKR